ncbi:unnamed protein product [Prorocentrum cordatum]|uniref:Uncharacterized protein n=1 Tax=Prorocentrum cordatum TaxID=2364126 RepID=A0ABN9X991_9DINO|nr:unnamed protein product [Polarella glacialis]
MERKLQRTAKLSAHWRPASATANGIGKHARRAKMAAGPGERARRPCAGRTTLTGAGGEGNCPNQGDGAADARAAEDARLSSETALTIVIVQTDGEAAQIGGSWQRPCTAAAGYASAEERAAFGGGCA